ncbi:MAG: hypothetical protein ACFFCS_09575 [Candidatus Hodarchaeota archaeon]
MRKVEAVLGIGLLGATIACFIISAFAYRGSKPGMMDTAGYIGLYSMNAGIIALVIGSALLGINALVTTIKKRDGTPIWQVLLMYCLVGGAIIAGFIILQDPLYPN